MNPPDELARGLTAAAGALDNTRVSVDRMRDEVHRERFWRRVVVIFLAVVIGLIVGEGVFLAVTLDRQHDLASQNHAVLDAIQAATGPVAQARTSASVRRVIDTVVTETDCRVRDEMAVVLHTAFPTATTRLPATTTCPAFKP